MWTLSGGRSQKHHSELGMEYLTSSLPQDWATVTGAILRSRDVWAVPREPGAVLAARAYAEGSVRHHVLACVGVLVN